MVLFCTAEYFFFIATRALNSGAGRGILLSTPNLRTLKHEKRTVNVSSSLFKEKRVANEESFS